MATSAQEMVIRSLSNVADVADNGTEITVIGDKDSIFAHLYDIYTAFGRENVSYRTLANGGFIEMTIAVRQANTPNSHGESGDREYSPNASKKDVRNGR